MIPNHSIQISIDRGGTFTDVHASYLPDEESQDRSELVLKLLSSDPDHYQDAPREGVRRALEQILQTKIPIEERFSTEKIAWIRLSTTVGTNALLERKGANHALVITKGFKDLLLIGNQSRPKIFDLAIRKAEVLYSKVLEVDERVTLEGFTSDPKRQDREVQFDNEGNVTRGYDGADPKSATVVRGISGEAVRIISKPDESSLRKDLQDLYDNEYRSLAVVFLHSYTYPEHEQLVEKLAKKIGFTNISLSSKLSSSIKAVPRGTSSTADAYLTPCLQEYIDGFFNGFDESLRRDVQAGGKSDKRTQVEFMTSDGGLTDVKTFSGLGSILSGPAGGVVGSALTSWDEKRQIPIIGFDMGGTSSDLSRYDGRYEIVFETTTAGVTIQSPQLDVNTVAAGGGSRLFFRNSLFTVGPESCGAHPGPACYRKGGPLAVTDANLLLGRLIPKYFPKIFGDSAKEELDIDASAKAFDELCEQINSESSESKKSRDEIAYGFLKVANETMCRPIRALTEARGYDTAKHALTGFGGAAGQHCCSIAKTLGISKILLHKYSSILSAYGMSLADRIYEKREPSAATLEEKSYSSLKDRVFKLRKTVEGELRDQGFEGKTAELETYLNLRYDGTDTALMTLEPEEGDWSQFKSTFEASYKQEFGFVLKGREIIIDDIRIRGIGKSLYDKGASPFEQADTLSFESLSAEYAEETVSVYFEEGGRTETPLFLLDNLKEGSEITGPALILQDTQTIVLDPAATAKILPRHVYITL